MATISNTPRPGYVWDSTDNVWYPIGVGGHGHSDYITQATAVNPTIIDAKGDIITATAADTPARLAVGANGETLVADSSTATGLRYQANFAAGKNKIINGDFSINQRAFTSTTTSNTYGFDRFALAASDGTVTYSAQTFTIGTAPVAGYEATNFAQVVTTGQTLTTALANLFQKIEDVRTFAGQTITVSFWAKATSGTPNIAINCVQNFGTGGSPSASVNTSSATQTISTSWARYSFTLSIPSVSGKTVGTTSGTNFFGVQIWFSSGTASLNPGSIGIQSNTFGIWGVQVEAGSVATAFQTATGTIQGELAACQRYYHKSFKYATAPANNASSVEGAVTVGRQATSGNIEPQIYIIWKVQMRTAPSVTLYNVYSGTSGQWSDGTTVSANARAFNLSDTAGNIDNTDVAINYANAVIHYEASAEL